MVVVDAGTGGSRRHGSVAAVLTALVLALSSCGAASPVDPSAPSAGVPDGFAGFASCDGMGTITADASLYRDEPRYGNATELVESVRAWASQQPGFEQLWLDRDHHGWVHVGVHGADVDVASLQEQVARDFRGDGVVVVAVPYSSAQLDALAKRVIPALRAVGADPMGGWSLSVPHGAVTLHGVTASPEVERALQEFAGEPLCVDVVPAQDIVPEADQPTTGTGWRLLGHEAGAGEAYRTGVATTDGQLADLWRESGLAGPVPDVDWQREIVVWLGAVYGSSCPVRLDDVVVDGSTLHGQFVIPGAGPTTACTGDANPHAFVLALDRSRLPAGPFVVQLGSSDPPEGAPAERTMVDVDLSAPGSRATEEQLHTDPQAGPQPGPLLEDGYPGMPGNGARYVWRARPECDGVVIGPFDGSLWRLADGEAEWAEVDGQEIAFHPIDDELLVVSSPGMEYAFVRVADTTCGG